MTLATRPLAPTDRSASELTLRGLTKMFLVGIEEYSEERLAELDVQLCRLIEIVGPESRAQLSRSLAPVAHAPARALRRLAFDEDIAVAAPVISQSFCLTSDDLARVAQTGSPEHLSALCERPRLDIAVTDVLLERGDAAIALGVTAKPGAEISGSGFAVLICRAVHDQDLAVRLGTRPDIPFPVLKSLLSYVDERTRARILADAGPDTGKTVRRLLDYLGHAQDAAPARDFSAARVQLRSLYRAGTLTTNDVQRFAATGQYEHTVVAVSLLSGAPLQLIDQLFRLASNKLLLVPCRAADLSWPAAAAVMRLCSMGRPISADDMDCHRLAYLDMTGTAAQSALRHWVVHGPSTAAGAPARRPRVGTNRRRAPRRLVQLHNAVIVSDGRATTTCIIVDISATGAKLELTRKCEVPDRFVLVLSTSGGLRRACKVAWRTGTAIGVHFESHAP